MQPRVTGPFPYSPITTRPKLEWPGGARLALWIIPNIEFFSLQERPGGYGGAAKIPDIPMWSAREYGNRVGVFRLMEAMARHNIRGTVALNSDLCRYHPQIIAEGNRLGWEWIGHCQSNTRRLNEVPAEQEFAVISDTLAEIEAASGQRPVGWLGAGLQETWNTLDYLEGNGVKYVGDWCIDDQPTLMTLETGKQIIAMPYSQQLNDKPAFEHDHRTADEFRDMICRQFDVLYREGGRVMGIAIHPYLTGVPYRIDAFEAALAYICKHEQVWLATGQEIAEHYLAQTYHHAA
jgi:peptidoglycan/xylan/chitin deacetylase (PgdA/CDA1 family)